ncbi:Fis family transcriptional regulator [Pandoraea captiosa]|uniref:Protein CyaE n=2 Tax=Pandoraea captiosa TaxID=2508302 RepID=A0A5E5AGL2_9BURK|nr:Fis family transcriptional regulator [Pandoraea captiosa]
MNLVQRLVVARVHLEPTSSSSTPAPSAPFAPSLPLIPAAPAVSMASFVLRTRRLLPAVLALGAALFSQTAAGWGWNDPLNTMVPPPPAALDTPSWQASVSSAALASSTSSPVATNTVASTDAPLSLPDAVAMALTTDPRTRQAWAEIQGRQARLGVARSAYLPNVTATGSIARVGQRVTYDDSPEFDSSLNSRSTDIALNLTWVLYDFGQRSATVTRDTALVNAAVSSRNASLQTVFLDTVKAYYEAQARRSVLRSAREAERIARESFDAAAARLTAGIGARADQLQAETTWSRMRLATLQAESAARLAIGELALAIGARADTALTLTPLPPLGSETLDERRAVGPMLDQALAQHPDVLAAQAELEAAQANVDVVQSQGRPTISLTAWADRGDTPITQVTTRQVINNRSVGIQISIPLFEGFSRQYRVRDAQSEVDRRRETLNLVKRRIAADVWRHYEVFSSSADTLQLAGTLVTRARETTDVALGRYKAGVGTLLELLKAQNDLTDAEQQRIAAYTALQTARLQLAADVGRLSVEALRW